jgi:acetyl esterase/lipase
MRLEQRTPGDGNASAAVRDREGRTSRRAVSTRLARLPAVFAAAVAVACLSAWPYVKAHVQSIAVMREISSQPAPWIARSLTAPVTVEDLSYPIETPTGSQQVRARLYLPSNHPNAPAMVIFHGVHHLGIEEPRLKAFATAMAGCGLRVLTPELPGIKDYRVSLDSARTIGESVKWFAAQTGGPVGVMGLSFSGGLALVAAEDPQYGPDFKFVFVVGSQDSMERVSRYYMTGRDVRPDGTVEVMKPHEYGPLVIEYEYLEDFVPAADLEPIRAVLRAHLYEDKPGEDQALHALNPAQMREALALMDTSLPSTRAGIVAAIQRNAYKFAALSPEEHLRTLTTPVYLLHGGADNLIPSAETLWMASEMQPKELKAMLVSPALTHVDVDGQQPGVMDRWRLIHFFALVLQAAETRAGR